MSRCSQMITRYGQRYHEKVRETDSYLLQEDFDNIQRWCQKWLLKLHPEKCKVMHIGHSYQTTYLIEDSESFRTLQRTDNTGRE